MKKGLEFMLDMRKLCVRKILEARKANKHNVAIFYFKKARYWRKQYNLAQRVGHG